MLIILTSVGRSRQNNCGENMGDLSYTHLPCRCVWSCHSRFNFTFSFNFIFNFLNIWKVVKSCRFGLICIDLPCIMNLPMLLSLPIVSWRHLEKLSTDSVWVHAIMNECMFGFTHQSALCGSCSDDKALWSEEPARGTIYNHSLCVYHCEIN